MTAVAPQKHCCFLRLILIVYGRSHGFQMSVVTIVTSLPEIKSSYALAYQS